MLSWPVVSGTLVSVGLLYCILYLLKQSKRIDIRGKVVLITGASSGLGAACAKIFFRQGCRLILAGRSQERLMAVKEDLMQLKKEGKALHEPMILTMDLEDLGTLPKKAQQAVEMCGGVDILINNAGISYRGCIKETTLDVDQKLMTVNYFGQVALIKAILPDMLARNSGHIVGISSVQGKISIPYRSAYSASKHALQAFFDCLRAELSETRIGVSVVSPGYIQTNLSTNAVCGDGSKHGVMDKTTGSGMPAESVAQQVLQVVVQQKPDLVLAPLVHRLVIVLRALAPSLFFSVMAKRAKEQKKDYVKRG